MVQTQRSFFDPLGPLVRKPLASALARGYRDSGRLRRGSGRFGTGDRGLQTLSAAAKDRFFKKDM